MLTDSDLDLLEALLCARIGMLRGASNLPGNEVEMLVRDYEQTLHHVIAEKRARGL